jgi:hypothetical protein
MNEAELVEAWGLFLGNSQTALGLYLSVLTGYLIIAYLVGNKLTRVQVLIVTVLYVSASAIITLWFFAWWSRALEFAMEAKQLNPDRQVANSIGATWAITSMLVMATVASLYFMWSMRHSRTERPL